MSEVTTPASCQYCGAESVGEHICPECGRIKPLLPGADYFEFFGLERKLRIDPEELEKTFYRLSRQLHPDYYTTASESEKRASVERSSMLNDAYRTLSDPVSRAQYLLLIAGFKEKEKKAPPDLLEEVFELNMQVEELKAAKRAGDEAEARTARGALMTALTHLEKRLSEIDGVLFALFEAWDEAVDSSRRDSEGMDALRRMSELLSHRSYIRNLVRDISEEIG
jgi:molecular chaperone HscB